MQAKPVSPPAVAAPEAPRDSMFEKLSTEVDAAIEQCRALDDDGRAGSLRLKKALEGYHKHVLAQIIRRLKTDTRGRELLYDLVDDEAVYGALRLHGLLKVDINQRVANVVEGIRPYAQSHGGDVQFVRVEGDVAYVRMRGNCSGCSLSALTLKRGVEDRLKEQVPEISKIEILPAEPGPGLELPGTPDASDAGWIEGPLFITMRHAEPKRLQGPHYDILLVRFDDKVYAYRNACAHMGLPLDTGEVEATTIACPWHGFTYDLTSGECLSIPQAQLEPFPVRVDEGRIYIRPD
ncbi:MAG: NifU family protein [Bacteroidota bacterium]